MFKNKIEVDARFLLAAFTAWLASSVVLLTAASACVSISGMGEEGLGYINSALSFLAALAAGAAAIRARRKGCVYTGLVTGVTITIFALTLGYIISGRSIEPDGVLSVAAFSVSGALFGSVFFLGGAKKSSAQRRGKVKIDLHKSKK